MRQPTAHHPLYGEIPLIERSGKGVGGKTFVWYQYDPAFKPPLPPRAVAGDVTRQVYCAAHDVPKYFYVDEEKSCVQCRKAFVFSANEQKFWYETLRFNCNSIAIRCRDCRRRKQTERALREQIALALRQLEQRSNDPHALIDLARATVRYRERTGEGDLDRAIAAARRAHREWPESAEPVFWEAKCHRLAGRASKAAELFSSFLAKAGSRSGLKTLLAEAARELAETRAAVRRLKR